MQQLINRPLFIAIFSPNFSPLKCTMNISIAAFCKNINHIYAGIGIYKTDSMIAIDHVTCMKFFFDE